MHANEPDLGAGGRWCERLLALADVVRDAARGALRAAIERGSLDSIARPVAQGAGDVTYGIDVPTEEALAEWLERVAREQPLSLLTEETGWKHRGPGGAGGARELSGFDHGGPRIVVDPIDGTRNLMTDLRSAWTVIGCAPPGRDEPRIGDVALGVLAEIPDSRAASARILHAARGEGCFLEQRALEQRSRGPIRRLRADADARADHGYFPFFKYMHDQRAEIAAIEAEFLARLEREERADVRNSYDDQYISNGGQLALLALGTYRCIVDLRAWLAARRGRPTLTAKPYDVSGAILCARETGAVVTAVGGGELDFPLDATTPVSFVGWANPATRARLERHLDAALPRP